MVFVGTVLADERGNVSATPDMQDLKAKFNLSTSWLPAMTADGELISIEGNPENNGVTLAKPIVVTYAGENEITGAHDVYGAVSRDEGQTWHITNLSESASKASFTLVNGQPSYGHCRKPVMQVKGNRIFVVWSSRYATGGDPRYVEEGDLHDMGIDKEEPKHWQKKNTDIEILTGQQSADYADMGFSDVGEIAYSAVWACRGVIITGSMLGEGSPWLSAGYKLGDIVWYQPERLTSGVRDANQLFAGGAGGAGFALTWQEDPLQGGKEGEINIHGMMRGSDKEGLSPRLLRYLVIERQDGWWCDQDG